MIGKPEWFTYRIAGWGIRPKTKEGWTYTGIFLALILAITYLPIPENIKTYLIGTIVALLVIDSLHIMMQLPKVHDERQNYHQLLIERNVSFMAVISIIISMFILSLKYGFNNNTEKLPFEISLLIGILITMALTKFGSTLYVNKKL